jgi:hypothetical protein
MRKRLHYAKNDVGIDEQMITGRTCVRTGEDTGMLVRYR